jgi:glycolate dehydrogenase FAD-linked subunit
MVATNEKANVELIERLRRVVAPERVHTTPEDLAVFGYDGTWALRRPDVVVSPLTAEEVSAVVRLAGEMGLPVVARGGGTGLAGGSVPIEGGIVLNMTRMNRIIELDRPNMVAVVQPGVINATLQAEAEKLGLFYPPDPQSLRQCTLGGNIATSAGGPRCLKYGTTKDYMLGLQVVLADGRIIRTGGKLMKIQTGYNLTGLFTGSEGTLGVITEATLRLIPKPRYRGTVMAIFNRLHDAAESVNRVLQAGIVPLALEMMDNLCIRAVEAYKPFGLPLNAETILLIDQDGNDSGLVQKELTEIAQLCREGGAFDVRPPRPSRA